MGQLRAALHQAEQVPVPPADTWRVPYMRRLLQERLIHYYSGNSEEEQRVQGLLDSLVVN